MAEFTVTPETLRSSGQAIEQQGQALPDFWAPIAQASQSVQFGRGDDPISPLIQATLEAATHMLDSSIQTSAQTLAQYGAGVQQMADTFEQSETQTVTMLKPGS